MPSEGKRGAKKLLRSSLCELGKRFTWFKSSLN